MSIDRKSLTGHLASLFAYVIFGINIIVCKDLTTSGLLSPIALFCFRAIGAAALFWLLSLILPKERVERGDYPKIFMASMLGLFATQMSFFVAISRITPLDCSILTALTPIFTMFIAAVAIKEPVTLKKAAGVALSFCGVVFLVLNSTASSGGATSTTFLGFIMTITNGFVFALYLGIFRPLISKYSVVTFMKWMFLFSAIVALPFGAKEIITAEYGKMGSGYLGELAFLIFFSTFVAYFLVPVGQKNIRPTLVSLYSYVQPIIATVASIYVGMDILSWQKVVAAIAVFGGVVLVNRSRSAAKS